MTFQDIKEEMEFRGFKVNFTKEYPEGGGVTIGFPFENNEDNLKYGAITSFALKGDMDETRFISDLASAAICDMLIKISKVRPEIVSNPQIVYILENKNKIEDMLKQI